MSSYVGMCRDCTERVKVGKNSGYCLHYDNSCKLVAHNCSGPFRKGFFEDKKKVKP